MSASPVTLVGNLTADPSLSFLTNGTAKLTFSIAVNHYWTDQSGEKQQKPSYFNVIAWRNLAEDGGNVLGKGVKVVVTGRLEQRSYEDKEGVKKSVVEVVADNIGLAVSSVESYVRKERSAEGAPAAKSAARPAAPKRISQVVTEEEEPF